MEDGDSDAIATSSHDEPEMGRTVYSPGIPLSLVAGGGSYSAPGRLQQ